MTTELRGLHIHGDWEITVNIDYSDYETIMVTLRCTGTWVITVFMRLQYLRDHEITVFIRLQYWRDHEITVLTRLQKSRD